VWETPAPLITAPIITNTLEIKAAVLNLIIFVPTAVPNIFAAPFAPSDQPRKSPLDINNIIISIRLFSGI
jgi:hypothetical protein